MLDKKHIIGQQFLPLYVKTVHSVKTRGSLVGEKRVFLMEVCWFPILDPVCGGSSKREHREAVS